MKVTIDKKLKYLFLSLAIVILVISGIIIYLFMYHFSKSGYLYEQNILDELSEKYKITFQVLDRKGLNKNGYEILQLAPTNNKDIIFTANRYDSYVDGGFPTWYNLGDDYEKAMHLHYYAGLVQKHFGVTIVEVPVNEFYYDKPSERPSEENYIEVTLDNIDDIVQRSKAFFVDAEKLHLKSLFFKFRDKRFDSLEGIQNDAKLFQLDGFTFRYKNWEHGYKVLNETQLKEKMIRNLSRILSDKINLTFSVKYPNLHCPFEANVHENLVDYSISIGLYGADEKSKDDAALELYDIYTKTRELASSLKGFNLTEIKASGSTKSITLQKEDWMGIKNANDLYPLFEEK